QRGALLARGSQAGNVAMLKIPNTAVHDLEGICRGAGAEIGALDERDREAAQGRVTRGCCAERSAADHDDVELLIGKRGEISLHRQAFQSLRFRTSFSI